MKEITGLYFHMEQISPEAFQAQRLAEMEQMSRYRIQKLQEYKDWSDPEKREAKKAQYAKDEAEGKKLLGTAIKALPWIRDCKPTFKVGNPYYEITPVPLTRWQRIKQWLRRER